MADFKYAVQVLEFKEIHEMPQAWSNERLIGLLKHIEYEDIESIPDSDLREMCSMALSDFEVEEAAIKVLEYRLGDSLNKGQRQNLAEQLKEDRIWEEYSDLSFHEELFNIYCMLYWAFPKHFSTPDIVKITMEISGRNKQAGYNHIHPSPSFLCRILNDGMESSNIMQRLFGDQLASNSFSESEHIIWQFEDGGFSEDTKSTRVTIFTSWNWVDDLRGIKSYESNAFSDGQLK